MKANKMLLARRLKICAALSVVLLACGCTSADWDRFNLFPNLGGSSQQASAFDSAPAAPTPSEDSGPSGWMPPAPPAPAIGAMQKNQPQPDAGFCRKIALQAQENALESGFTPETAQRRFDDKMRDCQLVMGN